jgi:hypothetical protein
MPRRNSFAALFSFFSRVSRAAHEDENELGANAMADLGDTLTEVRPIQHWAYFPTHDSRAQFTAFIERRFSGIDSHVNPMSKGREFAVTFWHSGIPDPNSLAAIIDPLKLAAESCGGEYDGWETQVVTAAWPSKPRSRGARPGDPWVLSGLGVSPGCPRRGARCR